MATIRKRTYKSGKTVYFIEYENSSGRRCREVVQGSHKEAEIMLSKRVRDAAEEQVLGIKKTENVLLSDLCVQYLAFARAHFNDHSYKVAEFAVNNFRVYFRPIFINDITIKQIEQYKINRLRFVSSSTLKRNLTTINGCSILPSSGGCLTGTYLKTSRKSKSLPAGSVSFQKKK